MWERFTIYKAYHINIYSKYNLLNTIMYHKKQPSREHSILYSGKDLRLNIFLANLGSKVISMLVWRGVGGGGADLHWINPNFPAYCIRHSSSCIAMRVGIFKLPIHPPARSPPVRPPAWPPDRQPASSPARPSVRPPASSPARPSARPPDRPIVRPLVLPPVRPSARFVRRYPCVLTPDQPALMFLQRRFSGWNDGLAAKLGRRHFSASPRQQERVFRWKNYYPFWSPHPPSPLTLELQQEQPNIGERSEG